MKTFNQYITEVFDTPYTWRGGRIGKGVITPENDAEIEDYTFRTSDDGSVEINASHFWIKFGDPYLGKKIKKEGHAIGIEFSKDGSYNMSDEGDALRILATVLDIMKSIIKKHEPVTLYFSADKTQDGGYSGREKTGRAKAYTALVKRFASKAGYKSDAQDSPVKVEWTLTKK